MQDHAQKGIIIRTSCNNVTCIYFTWAAIFGPFITETILVPFSF